MTNFLNGVFNASELHKQWGIKDASATAIHRKVGTPWIVSRFLSHKAVVLKCSYTRLLPNTALLVGSILLRQWYPILLKEYELKFKLNCKKTRTTSVSTIDVWSSDVNSDSLLGLTAHWVDENFQRKSAVLQAHSLDDRHTGEYVAMQLLKMLESWKVDPSKVYVIVRNNGSNLVKAMEEASLPGFGCFAHSLQLAVHDGLLSQRAVKDLLATCRPIVGHFKYSSVVCHKWAHIQEICNCPRQAQAGCCID